MQTISKSQPGNNQSGDEDLLSLPAIPLDYYKTPTIKNWPQTKVGDFPATGNHGRVLTDEVIVLDFDPRNYPEGRNMLNEMWGAYLQHALTYTVKTPRKGCHLYFKKPAHLKFSKKQTNFPGVDFLSKGAQVCGAGTQTRAGENSIDGGYELFRDRPFADLPKELMDQLKEAPPLRAVEGISGTTFSGLDKFKEDCLTHPCAESEHHGDDTTYQLALKGRDYGLPIEATIATMSEHYNPRCLPPWDARELRKKVNNAYEYAKNTFGSASPEAKFKPEMVANQPDDVPSPAAANPDSYPLSQMGNAMRLTMQYQDQMRWLKSRRTWLVSDGKRWKPDNSERPKANALEVCRRLLETAGGYTERIKFAAVSCTASAVAGMLDLAQAYLPITEDQLDQDPYLLNCNNGTIDLRTGELRPHRKEDFITKFIDIDYDPNAKAPQWERFLSEIFLGSNELIECVQRATGSALIGSVMEHKLFILQGNGRNGKGTFINALHDALGDYAHEADPTLLTAPQKNGPNEGLVKLMGVRLVTTSETQDGDWLNEAVVKRLTGGDLLTGSAKHEHQITFKPSHTLFLVTNFEPRVKSQGCAIWARLLKIPFNASFVGQEDLQLSEKLRSERAGILKWLVEGCLKWQQSGLTFPEEVKTATAAYKGAQDALAGFLDDRCVLGKVETRTTELRLAYEAWCDKNNLPRESRLNKIEFPARMAEKFEKAHRKTGDYWVGVKLRVEDPNAEAQEKLAQFAPATVLKRWGDVV